MTRGKGGLNLVMFIMFMSVCDQKFNCVGLRAQLSHTFSLLLSLYLWRIVDIFLRKDSFHLQQLYITILNYILKWLFKNKWIITIFSLFYFPFFCLRGLNPIIMFYQRSFWKNNILHFACFLPLPQMLIKSHS